MSGLEKRHDRGRLLRIVDPASGHPVESDEGTTLGDLDQDARRRVVETTRVTDHDVGRVDAHRFEDLQLGEAGVRSHVLAGAVGVVCKNRETGGEVRFADGAKHLQLVSRHFGRVRVLADLAERPQPILGGLGGQVFGDPILARGRDLGWIVPLHVIPAGRHDVNVRLVRDPQHRVHIPSHVRMPTVDDTADPFLGRDPDLADHVVHVIGPERPIRRQLDRQVLVKQRHPVDGVGADVAQHRPDDRVPRNASQAGVCLVEPAARYHSEPGCPAEQLDHLTTGEINGVILSIHICTSTFGAHRS